MATLESDVARAAKAAGGDAVVLEGEGEEVVGHIGYANTDVNGSASAGFFHGNASTSAFSTAVKKHNARYLVVKYVDDTPTPTAAPQAQ